MITEEALAGMLADPARSGTYRLPPVGPETMATAVARAGLRLFTVDLEGCFEKADFLARLAEALHFPDWFGHNWDAVADCLGDMSWAPSAGYVIVLRHAEGFRRAAETDFATALEIFGDAAGDWARENRPMWFFIDTDPSTDPGLPEP